jgi:DNA-binding transcriptional MerR regulator
VSRTREVVAEPGRSPVPASPADGAGETGLLSIGAAASRAGVTERALRYYQELGLLKPSGHTKGGTRRYSQADLERVARIRELQALLGLNLEEIATVLGNEDRTAEIRAAYFDAATGQDERRRLLQESLGLAGDLRATVQAKRAALDSFLADLDARLGKIRAAIEEIGG